MRLLAIVFLPGELYSSTIKCTHNRCSGHLHEADAGTVAADKMPVVIRLRSARAATVSGLRYSRTSSPAQIEFTFMLVLAPGKSALRAMPPLTAYRLIKRHSVTHILFFSHCGHHTASRHCFSRAEAQLSARASMDPPSHPAIGCAAARRTRNRHGRRPALSLGHWPYMRSSTSRDALLRPSSPWRIPPNSGLQIRLRHR